MGIPTIKTIKTHLEWLDKTELGEDLAAIIVRQAMEWAEHGANEPPGAALEAYFDELPKSVFRFFDLDDYRNYGERIRAAFQIMDVALETHGVEYLEPADYEAQGVDYLNTGDTYMATVVYDAKSQQWRITSWGDIVEANEYRFR